MLTRKAVFRRAAPLLVLGAGLIAANPVGHAQRQLKFAAGQSVQPVYEGWEKNPDGSVDVWFGYVNKNYEEEVDIPIGADNAFEPGPADRGQPTHFGVRRHIAVFKIVLPKEQAREKLIWRLTRLGKTETVTAFLEPSTIIDRKYLSITLSDEEPADAPPTAQVTATPRTVPVGTPVVLSIRAEDDGLPKKRAAFETRDPGLTVQWSHYRGPGQVRFSTRGSSLKDGSGKEPCFKGCTGETEANFSEPGEYAIQANVEDGTTKAGGYCCWTRVETTVTVTGARK